MQNNLKIFRRRAGLTQAKVAEALDISPVTVNRHENNVQSFMESLGLYAELYQCKPEDLISENPTTSTQVEPSSLAPYVPRTVPVVGFVGAGAEVTPIDDHAQGAGLYEVEVPFAVRSQHIVGVEVKGDSMYPLIREGDVLLYSREYYGMNAGCLNRLCVVGLTDGRVFVKFLHKGSKQGHYTLASINNSTPPMEDVPVAWCGRVESIVYKP